LTFPIKPHLGKERLTDQSVCSGVCTVAKACKEGEGASCRKGCRDWVTG